MMKRRRIIGLTFLLELGGYDLKIKVKNKNQKNRFLLSCSCPILFITIEKLINAERFKVLKAVLDAYNPCAEIN
jgi:hypothetical protein